MVVRGWSLLPRRSGGVLRVQPDGHGITVRPVDHPLCAFGGGATLRVIVGGVPRPVFYFFHEWVRVTVLDAQGWGHPSDNARPAVASAGGLPGITLDFRPSLRTRLFDQPRGRGQHHRT